MILIIADAHCMDMIIFAHISLFIDSVSGSSRRNIQKLMSVTQVQDVRSYEIF